MTKIYVKQEWLNSLSVKSNMSIIETYYYHLNDMQRWLLDNPIIVFIVAGYVIAILIYLVFLPDTFKETISSPRKNKISFMVFFLVVPAFMCLFLYLYTEIGLLGAVLAVGAPLALIKMLV